MVHNEGHIVWDDISPPTNLNIKIDANENPTQHLSAVIHELLHVILCPMFVGRMAMDYQEIAVLAYETDMYAYITKSPARLAKWNDLIGQKRQPEKD